MMIVMVAIAMLAASAKVLENPLLLEWHNAAAVFNDPVNTHIGLALLSHQLGYFDILPLYVVLMLFAPLIALIHRHSPHLLVAAADSALPNVAAALKERKKITILAIGSTSASLRGPASGGNYAIVERFLESAFKGLDVEIVHRGVSGELAADAGDRIKTEVALTGSDLVL